MVDGFRPTDGRCCVGAGAGWLARLAAALLALALAACGEPTVSYEVKMTGEWLGHEASFAACLAACDARNRGKGCAGDSLAIELGSNPCDFACGLMVAGALDDGCPKEAAKLWNCEAGLTWTCASKEADPVAVQAPQCASLTAALAQCVADGGSTEGPPLTLALACDARCKAEGSACTAKPDCSAQCQAEAVLDLPSACTKLAAIAVKCQSKSVMCLGDTPAFESCTDKLDAVEACRVKETPMPLGQQLCVQGCAEVGKLTGCAEYAAGDCLDKCKYQATMPLICKDLSAAYWKCAADKATGQCTGLTGTWSGGCQVQESALQACTGKCLGDKCSCVPGSKSCNGTQVMGCSNDGKTQNSVDNCATYSATCVNGACTGGKICTDYYAKSCDGQFAQQCSGQGVMTTLEDCGAKPNHQCVAGSCKETCTPGTYKCKSNSIYLCLQDGFSLSIFDYCEGDSLACTAPKCVDGNATCVMTPAPAGSACDDDNLCTVGAACDGQGNCVGKPGPTCNDATDCTLDSCDKELGCVFSPDLAACNDGNVCTVDWCSSGKGCAGAVSGPCVGVDSNGWCYESKKVASMTVGQAEVVCQEAGGHLASIHSVEEQQDANTAILKSYGFMTDAWIGLEIGADSAWHWTDGSTLDYANWQAGSPSTSAKVGYLGYTGKWVGSTSLTKLGRVVCKRKITLTCDDGDACTEGDKCTDGACKAGPALCDDKNACTVDLCDSATATACSFKPVAQGASCDDGQVCGQGDACNGQGECKAATVMGCDDSNPCTADSCVEPTGCQHLALQAPISCGDGLACIAKACQAAGTCGDGAVNSAGEECDDKNSSAGDGCANNCKLEPAKSCAVLSALFPQLVSGLYAIDPDGPGPLPVVELYCDMANGGWTLLANIYDTAGDDVPNLPADVTSGWQQVGNGMWQPVAQVAGAAQESGSAAVGMDFVVAMTAWGTKNLRFCFVTKSGQNGACVDSLGTLGLGGKAGANPQLSPYLANPLAWTYGRLSGLPASANSYDPAGLAIGAGCVSVPVGQPYEFGTACTGPANGGLCEGTGTDGGAGVWCGHCDGSCFFPAATGDGELAAVKPSSGALLANPSLKTWGFRIYAGP